MPFFNSATNFEIQNSTFNDIAGNYSANNTTTNRTLTNSNNKRAKTVENSYNDSSMGWNTRDNGAEEMMVRSDRRAPAQRTGRASADHTSFVPSTRRNTGSISRSPDRPLNLLQHLDLNSASEGSESISIPSGGIHSGRTRREDSVTVAQADPHFDSSDDDSTSESTTLSDHQDTDLESEIAAPNAVIVPFASTTQQPQEPQTLEPETQEEHAPSPPPSPPTIPIQTAAVLPPPTPLPVQPSAHHHQGDNEENGKHDVRLEAVTVKEKIDDDREAETAHASQVAPAPELPKPAPTNTNTKPEKKSKIKSFFHMKRPSFRRDSQ